MAELDPSQFDAVVLPGGFGAALNLSTFATEGPAFHVHAQVSEKVLGFHKLKKPIGYDAALGHCGREIDCRRWRSLLEMIPVSVFLCCAHTPMPS